MMKFWMIMGITGGVLGLLIGILIFGVAVFAGSVGEVIGNSGAVAASEIVALVGIGLPIMSIVGGALVLENPKAAVICMALPALVFVGLVVLGSNSSDSSPIAILVPGLIMGMGAVSVLLKMRSNTDTGTSA